LSPGELSFLLDRLFDGACCGLKTVASVKEMALEMIRSARGLEGGQSSSLFEELGVQPALRENPGERQSGPGRTNNRSRSPRCVASGRIE